MSEQRIEIEPFAYIAIYNLKLEQEINRHARGKVTVLIRDEWKDKYVEMLSGETWVKVSAADRKQPMLFYGLVTGLAFRQNKDGTIMSLELAGGTVLMDQQQHFRIFQNGDSKCIEIFDRITATYPGGLVMYLGEENAMTEGMLIQYDETDWEFLKRLAALSGMYLTPNVLRKGAGYAVGLPQGTKRAANTEGIILKTSISEYMKKTKNGMTGLQPSDMMEISVSGWEPFQMGDCISFHGKEYHVYRIEAEYNRGELIYTHYLRTKEALKILPESRSRATGHAFEAVVTAVERDRVRIDIAGDEWKGRDGRKWFTYATVYSSPDGAGWYCMPEPGDSVRLYVPGKESDSFVASAVHKETDRARQNPDRKSFQNRYGKEILLTPECIRMTNNKGMWIELHDREGITIASDKDIRIQAGERLTIDSEDASLLISADDKVEVRQGGTAMTLHNDISFTGGEFRIQ